MTDEAREALEDVTRAVAEASSVTTPAERLELLLRLVDAECDLLSPHDLALTIRDVYPPGEERRPRLMLVD